MDRGNLDRVSEAERVKLIDLRIHAARAVALVDSQNDGLFGLFEHRRDLAVGSRQADRYVHDHDDDRRSLNRDLSLTAHELQHLAVCARLNAAGIDEREAPSVPVAFAIDPVARHARRVLDNRHALAGQFIEEHRFADIRPAHDCYNRFCHRYYLPLTQKQPLRRGRCPHRPGGTNRFYGNLRRIRSCPWGDVGIAPYAIHGGFTQRRGHFLYLHRAYLHTSNRIRKEGGCVQPPSHSRIERTYLASTEMTSRPL